MVGISLPSTSGPDGTTPFVAGDVVFRPKEFTGTITNDWTTVPYCTTNFGDYDNLATDHLLRVHIAANIKVGLGDICRYMRVVDGSHWRIPTAAEWVELYGSDQLNGVPPVTHGAFGEGSFTPLSGQSFGPNRNIVRIVSDIEVTNADPYDAGAVFLPASGFRHHDFNGAIWQIGAEGDCWSATASDINDGYDMTFHLNAIGAQWSAARTYGFAIRCIRE